jgi:hypothetical protein
MDDQHQGDTTPEDDGTTIDGEDESPEPTASTYAWAPSGAVCEVCGTEVKSRWRDESGLVCEECKDW